MVSNEIIMLLSYLFILLLCFSTEYETRKENNYPDIDIGKVNMEHGEKAIGVNIAPINKDYIVGNEDDKCMFDGDVTFISNFLMLLYQKKNCMLIDMLC